jgi:Phage-related protein, predicted endonuclease
MTAEERAAFVAERKKGIGGSDVASLFNAGYGCRLRLWRDKRNEVPDFPRDESDLMELGNVLEPFFAEKYKRKTGRDIVTLNEPVVHPEHPELRVNVDRMINDVNDDNRDVGVLEIKSVGRAVFYKTKREGLPEDYILQLQHGMLVTGAKWGAFAIGCRDTGELVDWDVEPDPAIATMIIAEGETFWAEVQNGVMPQRLEPDDSRCQKCEYRRSCQGAALIQIDPRGKLERDETLRPILTEYLERKALEQEATELVEESKEQLKTQIGNRVELEVAGHKIYFRPQTSMRGDFKGLGEVYDKLRLWALAAVKQHPELGPQSYKLEDEFTPAETFRSPSESRPLRVY